MELFKEDAKELSSYLSDEKGKDVVEAEDANAKRRGISGVPYFEISSTDNVRLTDGFSGAVEQRQWRRMLNSIFTFLKEMEDD